MYYFTSDSKGSFLFLSKEIPPLLWRLIRSTKIGLQFYVVMRNALYCIEDIHFYIPVCLCIDDKCSQVYGLAVHLKWVVLVVLASVNCISKRFTHCGCLQIVHGINSFI